ncbi:penicillin-binding protein activator [Nitrosomonas supralitoralis]|uniref:Penicillin-binding protein activator n=1 Tax=Nitrosomonas supralitoralis TaxID=2116706 RepID=A0A2P7NTQ0_9PROT|nr:penicillin-binding protein activator [Nitrosomonas supralitoralis]PSJ16809.1 penicillin-binding protein activator [Nitrosomonas supralitoralis]
MQRFFTITLGVILLFSISFSSMALDLNEQDQVGSLPESTPVPHIALLLPFESASFGEAANIVKEGFVAATQRGEPLPAIIRLYSTTDDPLDILITYYQALSAGAIFIVGPLTRDGVSAVASSHFSSVPTLALNTADSNTSLPPKLYFFGLQMESEANQLAELALSSGRNHAIIIGDDSPLSKRLQNAFTLRWQNEIDKTSELFLYADNPAMLQQFRNLTAGSNHLVFLALDAVKSRLLRSYLDPEVPVYATSQIFSGTDNFLLNNDLNGIQFLDMPWILQPDHPAVMAYRHTSAAKSIDMERLYALGIDAFRLLANLMLPQPIAAISIDGVTGQIRFEPPNQFVRELVAAQFVNGKVQLITTLKNITEDEGQ